MDTQRVEGLPEWAYPWERRRTLVVTPIQKRRCAYYLEFLDWSTLHLIVTHCTLLDSVTIQPMYEGGFSMREEVIAVLDDMLSDSVRDIFRVV